MDFNLSPDALMLRDMLRRFIEKEVRPLESKYFSTGMLQPEERLRLRSVIEQMGLWGLTLPAEFDGGELDLVTSCVLEEELGKTFIPLEIGDIPPMLYACQGDQIQRFLKPVLAGKRRVFLAARESSGLRPEDWQTTADPVEQGYILSGAKLLASTPRPEDLLVVFAKAPAGHTAFLLDANQGGLEIRTNGATTLQLKQCAIGANAVLGESGQALTLGADEAPRGWIRIGARYVGLVERLLEMSAAYALDWVSLGAPLKDRPAVQRMLADMQVQLEACRWLVYHAAWLGDQQEPLCIPSAQVRLASTTMLQKAVDYATMIFGGPGPMEQVDAQQILMNAMPGEALEMVIESARAMVASHVLAKGQRS